jgi:hypothetical protein
MSDPLLELSQRLEVMRAQGDWEEAFGLVADFVRMVNAHPAAAGRLAGSPRLDALLRGLIEAMPSEPGAAGRGDDPGAGAEQVYVATAVHAAGGHSRMLEDMVAAQPRVAHRVLLTNLENQAPSAEAVARLQALGAAVEVAPDGPWLAKIDWLTGALAAGPRSRVFLLCHHEDVVALAAGVRSRHPRVWFIHHADHHLAAGLFLADWQHLDVSGFSFRQCRDRLGVGRTGYLPLVSPLVSPRTIPDGAAGPQDPGFVTGSSGQAGKFDAGYAFPYPVLIAGRLAAAAGTHVHIGGLSAAGRELFEWEAARLGVDPARLREIAHVPSLAEAMAAETVSVYIGSFPIAGARATIEVLSTGTPVLGHRHLASEYLGGQGLLPEAVPVWSTPEEFFDALAAFDGPTQRRVGEAGRAHWEAFHHPRFLVAALADPDVRAEPPPRRSSPPTDPLHEFFDRQRGGSAADVLAAAGHHRRVVARVERLEARQQELRDSLARARARGDRLKAAHPEVAAPLTWRWLRPLARLESRWRRPRPPLPPAAGADPPGA